MLKGVKAHFSSMAEPASLKNLTGRLLCLKNLNLLMFNLIDKHPEAEAFRN